MVSRYGDLGGLFQFESKGDHGLRCRLGFWGEGHVTRKGGQKPAIQGG